AGKTTTLKIFTDMIRASEGRAQINGVDVHLNKKKALASVGALIESPEIYPALTPREALSMVTELRGLPRAEAKKKIEETVAEVKMNEWLDKKVGKFSKGMKQRINIAAALLIHLYLSDGFFDLLLCLCTGEPSQFGNHRQGF